MPICTPVMRTPTLIGPSGPVDPQLIVLSVQSQDGRPIAVLANYSMHYFGAEPVSADYYGQFAAALATQINAQGLEPPFVGIMSQGTSGDQMWMDYDRAEEDPGLDAVRRRRRPRCPGSVSVDHLPRMGSRWRWPRRRSYSRRRTPDAKRLAWATAIVEQMKTQAKTSDRSPVPQSLPQVYARRRSFWIEEPRRELKLQAIRDGRSGNHRDSR